MPILKSPPRPPKNETLQIRIEEDIRSKLAKYAEFIDTSEAYVVSEALVFCKPDGSQLMQRDILKYSLHPILKKLELEQGGLNIFRRFRITKLETAEVPAALQHTWSGHARTHVSEVYKKLLKQREWRLGWAERAGMGFSLPERKNPRNAQLAQLIEFRKVG